MRSKDAIESVIGCLASRSEAIHLLCGVEKEWGGKRMVWSEKLDEKEEQRRKKRA